MNNTRNVQTSNITGRIRSSLVIKLNIRMLTRLFSAFLSINILFSILFFGVAVWKAEEGTQTLIDMLTIHQDGIETEYYAVKGYNVVRLEEPVRGVVLPDFIQYHLPVEGMNVIRGITAHGINRGVPLMQKIGLIKYNVSLSIDDVLYNITYALGTDLRLYIYVMLVIILSELIILIGSIGKGSKAIRKTLKPLAEMAETARTLNAEVASMRTITNGTHIKNLAGAINNIDAKKLDRRISIDESQNELKDLALAINDMLNRISTSFQSQIRFVSDASHELRTPISVIQGYVNLLDRWGKKDEKTMQESIDAIKSETQSMKELVEQLLFLARGDNETMQLHKEIFDVCDIVDDIIRETQMIDSNHVFETQLNRPAYIEADQQLLKQVIRILVDNSIKYTPVGEKICLKIIKEDNFVRIMVQDNGIGIAPEDLSHIFDRFYRSDESRARKTGGSGLGLSIAKWIIERHGGHFEVLSRVDIGTRTTIVMSAVNDIVAAQH